MTNYNSLKHAVTAGQLDSDTAIVKIEDHYRFVYAVVIETGDPDTEFEGQEITLLDTCWTEQSEPLKWGEVVQAIQHDDRNILIGLSDGIIGPVEVDELLSELPMLTASN